MNTIKLNNTEFEVLNYNKNTYFNGNNMDSNASMQIKVSDVNTLTTLAQTTITSIQIYHNEEVIYSLSNLTAKITSIGEWLNNDHMEISINVDFNPSYSEPVVEPDDLNT